MSLGAMAPGDASPSARAGPLALGRLLRAPAPNQRRPVLALEHVAGVHCSLLPTTRPILATIEFSSL